MQTEEEQSMKIAMLTNNYKPFVGGVPISVERQARELAKLGHEVTVFAPEYKQTDDGRLREEEEGPQERLYRHLKKNSLTVSMYIIRCLWGRWHYIWGKSMICL